MYPFGRLPQKNFAVENKYPDTNKSAGAFHKELAHKIETLGERFLKPLSLIRSSRKNLIRLPLLRSS